MSILALGLDPGQHTGLIVMRMPDWGAPESTWVYVSHHVINTPKRALTTAENHGLMFEQLRHMACHAHADIAVLEEPKDGAAFWGGQGQGRRRQARETAFALGRYYGLALAACQQARIPSIFSYPVIGNARERGWMPPKTKRETIFAYLRSCARAYCAPDDLPEHCLAALGVLRFHFTYGEAAARSA